MDHNPQQSQYPQLGEYPQWDEYTGQYVNPRQRPSSNDDWVALINGQQQGAVPFLSWRFVGSCLLILMVIGVAYVLCLLAVTSR